MSRGWCVVWFACVALAQDDPYCSVRYERLCQGKGPHVACQYPTRGAGPSCENYTSIIFSNDLKQYILHYVNRRRQKIASGHERVRGGVHLPKPEMMMLVQWDRELAYLAQRLADQCKFIHDDCRATVRYPYAGQTVGEVRWRRTGASFTLGARRAIGRVFDAWWGERRRVHAKQLISPFVLTAKGAIWGHFSQLAVWTLRAMGCGAVHHGFIRPRLLLVCDFSHTNMLGQRTISPGPLAACPPHTLRTGRPYPLLCGGPNTINSNQVIEESDGGIDEEEYEEMDEDEEESEEEEVVTRQSLKTEVFQDGFFPTRPWPNRPVVSIQVSDENNRQFGQQSSVKTDNQPHKQHRPLETFTQLEQGRNQHRKIDTHYNPVIPLHRTGDEHGQPISEQLPGSEEFRNMDIGNQPVRQQGTMDSDIHARQRYNFFTNTDHKRIRQHKILEKERHFRPVQDIARPIKDMVPINHEDDDYRYDKHSQDLIESNRATAVIQIDNTERLGRTRNFKNMGSEPNRPIKVDVIDSNIHSVIPIHDDKVDKVHRPIIPQGENYDDDITWKKNTVTDLIKVSVKYREDPDSPFQQKFNDELSFRNRELQFRNSQYTISKDSDNGNRESENKVQYKMDRIAEMRRKGEYKANGYGRKKSDRDWPLVFQRWGGDAAQEMREESPLRKSTWPSVQHVTTIVVYRPTSLFSVQTEPMFRQRWLQTRVRPIRPGANALLQASSPSSSSSHLVIKSKKVSLLLDKDDEEQLYHDTGFKRTTKNR